MFDGIKELLLQSSPGVLLVVSLIKATLVLTLVQLVIAAVPRLSAATRHVLLTAGLAAFIVIPTLALIGPKWPVAVANVSQPSQQFVAASRTDPAPAGLPLQISRAPEVPAGEAPAAGREVTMFSIQQIGATAWLVVSLFLLARLVRSILRVRRIVHTASEPSVRVLTLLSDVRRRLGIEAAVRVLRSDRISVPMVWGLSTGTLLLPAVADEWSDEELRATFIHELGHLQRLDYFSLTVMNVVTALLWFHPQVWSARQRALTEGERACDDMVIRSGERASEYASHLLQVARLMPRRDALTGLLAMSRPSQLEGRMYAILSPSANRRVLGGKLIMTLLALIVAAVTPLSILQLTAMPAATVVAQPPTVVHTMPSVMELVAPFEIEDPTTPAVSSEAQVESRPVTMNAALNLLAAQSRGLHRSGNFTETSRRDTGTCEDFDIRFDDAEIVRSEEMLTIGGRRLEVTAAQNGGIRIRRSSTAEFTVIACKAAGGATEAEAAQVLSALSIEERGESVTVSGPDEGRWLVHLIVNVPDGADIRARATNGPLSVQGVNARINAEVVNGPLALSNSRGDITARSTNGPLAISRLSGNVDAWAVNGPLSVQLEESWNEGELRASVTNGPLSLKLPRNLSSSVHLKTNGQGPLACSLEECRALMASEDHQNRNQRPREITFGSGPTRVFLTGGNGPVAISSE